MAFAASRGAVDEDVLQLLAERDGAVVAELRSERDAAPIEIVEGDERNLVVPGVVGRKARDEACAQLVLQR